MPSLRDIQDRFTQAIFDTEAARIDDVVLGGALAPADRLDIYRNNVLVNYRNALRDTYPALVRLVGDEFFNAATRRYARTHPSQSGDLHDYGETFADFLERFEPARALPYLPDMARLEWAMHRVFHAADALAVSPADFSGLAEARMPALRLLLHPATRLLSSIYPVLRIWQVCQPGQERSETSVDVDEGGQCLLVIRRDYAVHLELLSSGEYALLVSLQAGNTLGAAVEAALRAQSDFDLGAGLARHVTGGTFVSLEL